MASNMVQAVLELKNRAAVSCHVHSLSQECSSSQVLGRDRARGSYTVSGEPSAVI